MFASRTTRGCSPLFRVARGSGLVPRLLRRGARRGRARGKGDGLAGRRRQVDATEFVVHRRRESLRLRLCLRLLRRVPKRVLLHLLHELLLLLYLLLYLLLLLKVLLHLLHLLLLHLLLLHLLLEDLLLLLLLLLGKVDLRRRRRRRVEPLKEVPRRSVRHPAAPPRGRMPRVAHVRIGEGVPHPRALRVAARAAERPRAPRRVAKGVQRAARAACGSRRVWRTSFASSEILHHARDERSGGRRHPSSHSNGSEFASSAYMTTPIAQTSALGVQTGPCVTSGAA